MRIKSFILGLGIGMAFVSIIVLILGKPILNNDGVNNKIQNEVVISDEDVIKRAKELGMISLGELPSREKETEANVEVSLEEDQNEDLKQEETEYLEETDDREIIEIMVIPGSNATRVVQELYAKGLIDDAEGFKNYLIEKGVTTKIKSGRHSIPVGADYDEIIEVIKEKQ